MDMNEIKGNWKELKGTLRQKWGKLTDDDLEQVAGRKDVLIGRLQALYGRAKDEAEREVDEWISSI